MDMVNSAEPQPGPATPPSNNKFGPLPPKFSALSGTTGKYGSLPAKFGSQQGRSQPARQQANQATNLAHSHAPPSSNRMGRERERERDRDRDRERYNRRRSHSRERDGGGGGGGARRDRDRRDRRNSRSRSRSRSRSPRSHRRSSPVYLSGPSGKHDESPLVEMSAEEQQMREVLGFASFHTTKGKKVDGNNVGAVHVIMKRKYRQYMNRKGGFNRPLDFVA